MRIYACEHAVQCSAQMNNIVIKQVYILCFVVVVLSRANVRGGGRLSLDETAQEG